MKVKYGVLPWEWEHRVCTCSQPGPHVPHRENPNYMSCSICLKYVRYVMVMCSNPECGTRFPKVFEHPMYCSCRPLCWDCCENWREEPCSRERCLRIKANSKRPERLEALDADRFPRTPVENIDDLVMPEELDLDLLSL